MSAYIRFEKRNHLKMTNRIELDDLLGNQADFEARYRRELASAEAELARNLPPANGIEVAPAIPGTVVTVGAGRGFVVTGRRDRLVITAAHCLTRKGEVSLPPPMNFSYTQERTYPTLLGPLGKKPTVWAECLFVDPISDIAVLGPPDDQALYDEYNAYETLMEEANDFPLTSAPMKG